MLPAEARPGSARDHSVTIVSVLRVGVFLQVCDLQTGRVFSVDEVATAAQRAEALGYDSVWVMDHPILELRGRKVTGHDPFVLLAYVAARTRRVRLGTLVVCTPFRSPGQLARESAALADASGGRFILGLGAGWHEPEFTAFGIPFTGLVSRFEEQADAATRLLRGERVSRDGRYVTLSGAEVLATAPPPPVWIAAKGPRMLRLTARIADGWNLAWGGEDPAWLREPIEDLRRELDAAGRDPEAFTFSAGLAVVPDGKPGQKLVVGGPERVAEVLRAYQGVGIGYAILSFSSEPVVAMNPDYMEETAPVLKLV